MKKKHTAFNTQLILIAVLALVFLGLCISCVIEGEIGLSIGFGIVVLVAAFVFAVSPLYFVFSGDGVEIAYGFGQREQIRWRDVRTIWQEGSWIGGGGLPRYVIGYPRQDKRPFFAAGEIPKTAKTTKYITQYYKGTIA